ncbi:MAG: YceI family protein [Bacteroidales bacterium]|nr:YceI family protein [Bacteroidales bacterium]
MLNAFLHIVFFLGFLTSLVIKAQDNYLAYNPGIACMNYIHISGRSNVNRFEFSMDFPSYEAFIVAPSFLSIEEPGKNYDINIPVKKFKTNNNLIYQDFLALLKVNKHPEIVISIGSRQLKSFRKDKNLTYQPINITLAGITKEYLVACNLNICSDNTIYVNGHKKIRLSDFHLDPPEKFQGLVKVKDEVMINFGFVFLYKETSKTR